MPPISTDDIRQAYLNFFQERGHAVIPGASLIPDNDPTVLFTTAGMHPLVPYLMGEPHPAGKRLVDVQRCVRTQDIDEVGDASHLTIFEMLGRWSLGDYFKQGAIEMSYEFMIERLGIPKELFAVTCFEGDNDAPRDDESAALWKSVGVPENRIGFLPKKNNWWGPAGATGPCGPDTEMFYWWGKEALPPAGSNPANDEDNWVEIGNDVLIQYNKTEDGTFELLPQPNLDEGLGLDRLAYVLQRAEGANNVYETDRMRPILETVLRLSPREHLPSSKPFQDAVHDMEAGILRHARIVTDHIRAASFIIADGIKPGNVDQGYVLRRLIRRAIRSARALEIEHDGGCTPRVADEVIAQYGGAYGHLQEKSREIREVLSNEEQQFRSTLQEGLKHFERAASAATGTIDGQSAFHLYDTYGFPYELTRELAAERKLHVDEKGFAAAFEQHQATSRAGAEQKFKGGLADNSAEVTKLHTATHLLNAALRKVLGDHVWQRGSNITAERLRFDFTHDEKMTPEQIEEVEKLVNYAILQDFPVSFHLTNVEGAKKEGAIGVFDDRYAAEVKVYVIGDDKLTFSKEICGGPHVSKTGVIGSFKIQKEESSSGGIRRIKAVISGGPEDIETAKEA